MNGNRTRRIKSTDKINGELSLRTMMGDFSKRKTNSSHVDIERDLSMGEITGKKFSQDEIKFKMPIRTGYTTKKPILDNSNKYLEFDLHNKTELFSTSSNVMPNQSGSEFTDIDASTTKISSEINPNIIVSKNIEKLGMNMFSQIYSITPMNEIIINNLGLFTMFTALYLGSSSTTEIQLNERFNFGKKQLLELGINNILDELIKDPEIFNMTNIMIIGDDVPIDINYMKAIDKYCSCIRVSIDDIESESHRVNKILKKFIPQLDKIVLIGKNLINLQLMLANLLYIHPKFDHNFNLINSHLYSIGGTFDYFEDSNFQHIELKISNDKMRFGICIGKTDVESIYNLTLNILKTNISKLKESVLNEVKIPCFTQNIKLRLNKLLMKYIGIDSVFIKLIVPELFPESAVIHDVVQNIKIQIDLFISSQREVQTKSYKSDRNFIVNDEFMYYFRLSESDTIILFGNFKPKN